MTVQKLSIEVTNKCQKGCSFCYNSSNNRGTSKWTVNSLVDFICDCQQAGTEAVSFGGGEPLLFEGIYDVLQQLKGRLFRSLTTNGLLIDDPIPYKALLKSSPDKVHISIHDPTNFEEVNRVIRQVIKLDQDGITSGVNLLVHRSSLEEARDAAEKISQAGIGPKRVIYIPRQGEDSPSPEQVASVVGTQPFQSISCLQNCRIKPDFCAVGWDQRVGWCSYTSSRRRLPALTAVGLNAVLRDLHLLCCETQLPRV